MNETGPVSQKIIAEVTTWPGVEVDAEERGELSLKVGRREIGHLHSDHVAHFSFPKATWTELFEQRRISPHPVFPDRRGPAQRRIETDADVADVIGLLRFNYERVAAGRSSGPDAA